MLIDYVLKWQKSLLTTARI